MALLKNIKNSLAFAAEELNEGVKWIVKHTNFISFLLSSLVRVLKSSLLSSLMSFALYSRTRTLIGHMKCVTIRYDPTYQSADWV